MDAQQGDQKLNGYDGSWTQDAQRELTTSVPVSSPNDLKHWFLVFVKGKMFNVHTPMYSWLNLSGASGQRWTFEWQRD
jgi:hypothetical protein